MRKLAKLEAEQIAALRAAKTQDEIQAAIVMNLHENFSKAARCRIQNVRAECGKAMVRAHPLGKYVPIYESKTNRLHLLGESYKVGHGQNGAGVRYVWHFAKEWARDILQKNGFSRRASYRITDTSWDYLHRALPIIEAALAGEIPDPDLNILVPNKRSWGEPVKLSVEQNAKDSFPRATRTCQCGGTLFDWGASSDHGWDWVSWYCNKCPESFTEYLADGQLYAMRGGGEAPHPAKFLNAVTE